MKPKTYEEIAQDILDTANEIVKNYDPDKIEPGEYINIFLSFNKDKQ